MGTIGKFGLNLKHFLTPVNAAAVVTEEKVFCGSPTWLLIELEAPVFFNAVIIREDLKRGQAIAAYAIDYFDENAGFSRGAKWLPFPKLSHGKGVHGLSVGPMLIDFVKPTYTQKVRFRCLSSTAPSGGMMAPTSYISSISLHSVPDAIALGGR